MTSQLVGCCAALLAGTFAVAGAVKLREPRRAALALSQFGVGDRPVAARGALLGAYELALAGALAAGALAGIEPLLSAAGAAAALTASVFAALIARVLRSGESFECFCFGRASGDVSRASLFRALLLALGAAVVAVGPAPASGEDVLVALLIAAGLAGTAALALQARTLHTVNADPLGERDERRWIDRPYGQGAR